MDDAETKQGCDLEKTLNSLPDLESQVGVVLKLAKNPSKRDLIKSLPPELIKSIIGYYESCREFYKSTLVGLCAGMGEKAIDNLLSAPTDTTNPEVSSEYRPMAAEFALEFGMPEKAREIYKEYGDDYRGTNDGYTALSVAEAYGKAGMIREQRIAASKAYSLFMRHYYYGQAAYVARDHLRDKRGVMEAVKMRTKDSFNRWDVNGVLDLLTDSKMPMPKEAIEILISGPWCVWDKYIAAIKIANQYRIIEQQKRLRELMLNELNEYYIKEGNFSDAAKVCETCGMQEDATRFRNLERLVS